MHFIASCNGGFLQLLCEYSYKKYLNAALILQNTKI